MVARIAAGGFEPEPLPFDSLNGVPLAPALGSAGPLSFGDAVRHARRVYPHRHHTLGFFVARFRRPNGLSQAVAAATPQTTAQVAEVRA